MCIHAEEGRSAEVMGVGDNFAGSEVEAILAEMQKFDYTEEKVEAYWPVDRHMTEVVVEEMVGGMAGVKDWEMVYSADVVGSAEHTPGYQRPDPVEQKTKASVNDEHMP